MIHRNQLENFEELKAWKIDLEKHLHALRHIPRCHISPRDL